MINKKFYPIIGLEVHVALKTKSKMFCGCPADYFGQNPNTQTCPVCLGLPGALPVPNITAIEWCVMIGLALKCQIPLFSKFDRKNYFYPDLPKGYQISQYDQPFGINGFIKSGRVSRRMEGGTNRHIQGQQNRSKKIIRIRRVHMEEDTGKLIHATVDGKRVSLIDFNRSGVPLVEIVTEPDFENAEEVVEYLKKLQQIVRYLGVSDADMEKGDMRLEPNISIKEISDKRQATSYELPKYKVEVKNINSFKFVEKAINFEIERQKKILCERKIPVQETRGWDENKQKTISQRIKEEANDYRYFPEPDIPPITFIKYQIRELADQMPELPVAKLARFTKKYALPVYDAQILTRDKGTADFFEEAVKIGKAHEINPKQIANTIINKKIDVKSILPATLIKNILISKKMDVVGDNKLQKIINIVVKENSKAVEDYRAGHENAIMFLVGQVMKTSGLKLDPNRVKEMLKKMLQ